MVKLAGILVLLLASCSSKRPECTSFHYAPSFPEAYHGAAEYAVDRWSGFSGKSVTIDPGESDELECSLAAIPKDSEDYKILRKSQETEFLAIQVPSTGQIILVPDFWDEGDPWCIDHEQECARSILMHEIAHEY